MIPGLQKVNPVETGPVARVENRPHLAEIIPRYPAAEAATSFYRPPNPDMPAPAAIIQELHYDNLGSMLHQMFIEADQMPPPEMFQESERERQMPYTSQTELWHDFLGLVMKEMKSSDTVRDLRIRCKSQPETIGQGDIKALYSAYEIALNKARRIMKPDLTRPQHTELSEVVAHLDWSYKDVIAEHVLAKAENEQATLQFEPKDFLILLNPKARKIDYTTTVEAKQLVQHFGSRLNKDVLKRDTGRPVPTRLEESLTTN